jgi:hypothetical protein
METRTSITLALALVLGAAACSAPKPEPEYATSANHSHYARDFPDKLTATTKDFNDRRTDARKVMGELNGYPSKLKEPVLTWAHVLEIIERADEDGHSYDYSARLRRVAAAGAFFEAELDEINKKVSGSVAYAAKQKSCDQAIAGAAAPALKSAVEKQLEKELHEASEAHRLIDRYRSELGKENAEALEKQADDIARASYDVNIEIVEDKLRILRMVSEADQIKHTVDDAIAAEKAYQTANKKMTDAEKKASEARIAELNKSKSAMDAAMKQAEGVVPNLEEEIRKIQKEHDDAVEALKAKIKEKVK